MLACVFLDVAAHPGLDLGLVYFGGRHWVNDLHGVLVQDTCGVTSARCPIVLITAIQGHSAAALPNNVLRRLMHVKC